ncbi:MAG: type II secretion system protein GspG [Spartobacteria bacterium]
MRTRCSGGRVGRRRLDRRDVLGRAGDTPATTFGFTIVEVLAVMTIILVLAGLVLATSSYMHNKGARSRAEAEIAAMSAALENYKADNGLYPSSTATNTLNTQTSNDPSGYADASKYLFQALAGDSNADGQPGPGTVYMAFKPNQLGGTSPAFFVKDPFGNSYGYSTINQTDATKGYNPTFDLWSTAGSNFATGRPGWVKNW